ncbi:shikimate kinase [soil metagenome]
MTTLKPTQDATRPIILTGMMGAGKSHVGRLVAKRLGRRFVDLDREIQRKAGRSIKQIFAREGEAAFRELERQTFAKVIAGSNRVVATGGGALIDDATRALALSQGVVIYLRAATSTLAERLSRTNKRPLLQNASSDEEREAIVTRILDARSAAYEEAHAIIDVDDLTPDLVAYCVAEAFHRLGQAE